MVIYRELNAFGFHLMKSLAQTLQVSSKPGKEMVNGDQGLVLKLGFEKASVNWDYLFTMLRKFGFGKKWVAWMRACVTSANLSILINGSPSSEFKMERGLRQRDPLSPLLFNLVAEGLNILFERAKQENVIAGVKMGDNGPIISHLQFADDTIIF